jgi:Ca2+-binding EF-hand superfamily protein
MLSGQPAFHPDPNYQYQITRMTYYPMTGPSWEKISTDAKNLVARMLDKCPETRISIEDILKHPWCVGEAPSLNLGPEYHQRVKALALRQKLKRFFVDNDIEHGHKVRRQRLDILEEDSAVSSASSMRLGHLTPVPSSFTHDKMKLLKRILVRVISKRAADEHSGTDARPSEVSMPSSRSRLESELSNSDLMKGEIDVHGFCNIMLLLELHHLASPDVFYIFDINQDGKIDTKEFLLTLLSFRASGIAGLDDKEKEAASEDAASLYFRFFDLDDDGFISREELRAVVACLFHDGGPVLEGGENLVTPINVEDLFDLIDNNPKDGRIDIGEFTTFYHTILLPSASIRSVRGGVEITAAPPIIQGAAGLEEPTV